MNKEIRFIISHVCNNWEVDHVFGTDLIGVSWKCSMRGAQIFLFGIFTNMFNWPSWAAKINEGKDWSACVLLFSKSYRKHYLRTRLHYIFNVIDMLNTKSSCKVRRKYVWKNIIRLWNTVISISTVVLIHVKFKISFGRENGSNSNF